MTPYSGKIGVAFGGGAVLGAAHVGVIKAIEESGIDVGWISGTSIGALVGSVYAFGYNFEDIQNLALDMSWGDISTFSFSKYGLLTNSRMSEFMHSTIGDVGFEDSPIPLSMIATNISSGEKVIMDTGDIASAVLASTAIPGVFQPIERNGELLVDGGLIENVPISPLKNANVPFTIAIDLNSNQRFPRPQHMIDVLLNSFHITLATATTWQAREADILISPDLSEFNRVSMNQTDSLIQAGYEEATSVISQAIDKGILSIN